MTSNPGGPPADTVFRNGRVFLPASAAPAEVVAVKSGRITYVGPDSDDLVGPHTDVVDLAGGCLLPGFQDAHVHALAAGMQGLTCNLGNQPHSRAGYLDTIGDYAGRHPDDEWMVGTGWYADAFPGGLPTRFDLDAVVGDRPAVFTGHDGHSYWVNSRALQLAGIDAGSGDPDGGRILRDDHGDPIGILVEKAGDLVTDLMPAVSEEFLERALLTAQERLHALGVTAWQDAGVGSGLFGCPDDFGTYLALDDAHKLTARVIGALWWSAEAGLGQLDDIWGRRAKSGTHRFRATTVKVMQDGICENCTAAMVSPYWSGPRPGTETGMSFIQPDELRQVAAALVADDFQIHMHAVGDRAVRECLDALAAGTQTHPGHDGRHQIAHLDVVHPDDIPRFAQSGVIANIQALWARRDKEIVERKLPLLGPERERWHFPFRSLHDAGARLAMGSDWPVTDPNPLWAIHTATTRLAPPADAHAAGSQALSVPLEPQQAIDLRTAVEAYTFGSAYANHLDDVTGSITVGKEADLVVLDRDIFDGSDVSTARPTLTMVAGQTVFRTA